MDLQDTPLLTNGRMNRLHESDTQTKRTNSVLVSYKLARNLFFINPSLKRFISVTAELRLFDL